MSYVSIIEFARENKSKIVEDMKQKAAMQFICRLNTPEFDEEKELKELKIEEMALSRIEELLETVLEKMEKGEQIL